MKPNSFYNRGYIVGILLLLISSMDLKAQTPTNFTGKWQYDKANSTADKLEPDFDGTIIMEVIQNAATISFTETYKRAGTKDWKTAADIYKLDGKEQVTETEIGTSKKTAKWSADKKVLTITNIETQTLDGVLRDFIVKDSYKLDDNGKMLIIERYRKNPVTGETNAKKVYIKK